MPFRIIEKTKCDVLIIGSGGAGLSASIAAAANGSDVLMVSKARIGHASNTYLSKGIIAASGWGDPEDTGRTHCSDTIQGGRMLNNPAMVARFTEAIRTETRQIREWGVDYISDDNSEPAVMKIAGHSFARHLVGKDWKGSNIVLPLKEKARQSGVRFEEHLFVASLMMSENRVKGASCISEDGRFLAISAKAVILATGGFGNLYLNTNNAPGITGDGHALAGSAGVTLQDMEFVQYYPTARGKRGSRLLLNEKLLVQNGVCLRNTRGDDILKKNGYDVPGDVTRDQLAQVLIKEIFEDPEQSGSVSFDMSGLSPEAAEDLSTLLPSQWTRGERVFQVAPTTHFCMGGVVVDSEGQTSCEGLYAAGEVAAGAHGANRLGGNALAEVIAMGSLVGKAAAEKAMGLDRASSFDAAVEDALKGLKALFGKKGLEPGELVQKLKKVMWQDAGIVRSQESLERALETVTGLKNTRAFVTSFHQLIRFLEFRNMRFAGEMVCRSALERTESRGSHFRSDYPNENNDAWVVNIQIRQTPDGTVLETVSVPG